MKKLSVLFVSALVLGMSFTSCNKDDDDATEAAIEGKWSFTKQTLSSGGQNVDVDYPNSCSTSKDYIELKADGTAVDGMYSDDCKLDTENTKWTRDGNKLTIVNDATYEIISITETTLQIKSPATEGGQPIDIIYTLTR